MAAPNTVAWYLRVFAQRHSGRWARPKKCRLGALAQRAAKLGNTVDAIVRGLSVHYPLSVSTLFFGHSSRKNGRHFRIASPTHISSGCRISEYRNSPSLRHCDSVSHGKRRHHQPGNRL